MAPSRGTFVKTSAGAITALALGPRVLRSRADYDLILRGGTVFDGRGSA